MSKQKLTIEVNKDSDNNTFLRLVEYNVTISIKNHDRTMSDEKITSIWGGAAALALKKYQSDVFDVVVKFNNLPEMIEHG